LSPGAINMNICDYWEPHIIGADIATKKTLALNNVLQSFRDTVRNSWEDAFVDSQVLLRSWNRRGSRSHSLVAALKCVFQTTMSLNIDLHVHFVPGPENPADSPSRRLSFQPCGAWSKTCTAAPRATPLISWRELPMSKLTCLVIHCRFFLRVP